MPRGYVDTRWGQLHYVEEGTGNRSVLLLHETPVDAQAYARLQPLLAERYRVVAIDTPGYGASDPPPALTTISEYAKTFAEVIEALQLGEFAVVGAHTGCLYAIELAAVTMPESVRALVLAGVPLYADDVRAAKLASIPHLAELESDGSHFAAAWGSTPSAKDLERRTRTITAMFEHPETAHSAYHAVFSYDTAGALPLLGCPVLLLSTALDSLAAADERFHELVPDAELQLIETTVLPTYWTKAGEFASRTFDWLEANWPLVP